MQRRRRVSHSRPRLFIRTRGGGRECLASGLGALGSRPVIRVGGSPCRTGWGRREEGGKGIRSRARSRSLLGLHSYFISAFPLRLFFHSSSPFSGFCLLVLFRSLFVAASLVWRFRVSCPVFLSSPSPWELSRFCFSFPSSALSPSSPLLAWAPHLPRLNATSRLLSINAACGPALIGLRIDSHGLADGSRAGVARVVERGGGGVGGTGPIRFVFV